MPASKRASIRPAPKTYRSGTHPIVPGSPHREAEPPAPRARRNGLSALLVQPGHEPAARAEPATSGRRRYESVGDGPELEIELTQEVECAPALNILATVDAPCDGCGRVVEIELSRYLETNAVACTTCVDSLVKGWGRSLDRPTIEWEPSTSLLSASRRIDRK